MIDNAELIADCDSCLGLCCIAHYFSIGDDYSIDKQQYVPCPNLDKSYRCSIHEKLDEEGMSGCSSFNCWGAGQRTCKRVVTQPDWQHIPNMAQNLFEIYFKLREIHKLIRPLMTMLDTCSDPVLAEEIKLDIEALDNLAKLPDAKLRSLDLTPTIKITHSLVKTINKASEKMS